MKKSLLLLVAALILTGVCAATPYKNLTHTARDNFGVTVRMDTTQRIIYPVFSADSMFEGADTALNTLDARGIKASFFFTGNFLRDTANDAVVRRVIDAGHYVGPHSDGHILLADWRRNRPTLVDADSLAADLHRNFRWLAHHGVDTTAVNVIMPPYEWCNRTHVNAYRSLGLLTVNPTPTIETYRDYTTPDLPEYRTAAWMEQQLFDVEARYGLNGAILIIHLGTSPERPDKLYHALPRILDRLATLGYRFRRF